MAGLLTVSGAGFAQSSPGTVSDAQIEANVLKALANAPELMNQPIKSTTVYGTVTLTGSVKDEASRDLAEKVVSNTVDVKKVVDEMTVDPAAVAQSANAEEGTNPNLQSDGRMASSGAAQAPAPAQPPAPPAPPTASAPVTRTAPPPLQPEYGPRGYAHRPYVEQRGGDAVTVPSGALLRVRINEELDSEHTAVGTVFDGVVLNDVVAGGSVAIPRGAAIQGKVVDVHRAGEFKGRGALMLQLTELTLGGQTYPLVSNEWTQHGIDKTGQTVSNTVGLGAVGAMIGAVAGGGAGAAVGAGVGGVAGLGVSSASRRGEAQVPSEGIVAFRLTQPAELTTVSQAELDRLGAGVPVGATPRMQRRYPPPPYYYGPYYRPYPYWW
ncbi:BON domain-containing protein [Edaphobacter sp.]|uniref:BON domain-containing protein n=1 Tax=Edaphobacter sp. TaxID=1934404 RepID=UPI002DB8C365|nr:BON domain-containing protein [Edaphobacter sp.]HEU5340986.1 BON domain-containing protein [Edaphobacter sp.]